MTRAERCRADRETRATKRRAAAAIRRSNRKALAEFEKMSGGIIEGEIVRKGSSPSAEVWEALVGFLASASRTGTRCMRCRARMQPPDSWPGSFFAAYSAFGSDGAPRSLVAAICTTCTMLDDEALF